MNSRVEKLRRKHLRRLTDGFVSFDAATNRYLSGFSGSTSAVLITRKSAVFFTDFRYRDQSAAEVDGFEIKEAPRSLVMELTREARRLDVTRLAFEPTRIIFKIYRDVKRKCPEMEFRATDGWVESLREVKDAAEIDTIKKATAMAEKAYLDVVTRIKEGVREREVAAELDFMMKRYGADASAFEPIVLFGKRSALPHGQADNCRLHNGDVVLIDFGARYKGYHCDLTRTIMFGKIPSKTVATVYDTVLEAQMAAIRSVRPGIRNYQLDGVARKFIQRKGYGNAFGHGLGHGVGLEVHERPHILMRSRRELQKNMVLTIEPGIYLPEVCGVRIEDTVVVTEDGCNVLSNITKQLTVI